MPPPPRRSISLYFPAMTAPARAGEVIEKGQDSPRARRRGFALRGKAYISRHPMTHPSDPTGSLPPDDPSIPDDPTVDVSAKSESIPSEPPPAPDPVTQAREE